MDARPVASLAPRALVRRADRVCATLGSEPKNCASCGKACNAPWTATGAVVAPSRLDDVVRGDAHEPGDPREILGPAAWIPMGRDPTDADRAERSNPDSAECTAGFGGSSRTPRGSAPTGPSCARPDGKSTPSARRSPAEATHDRPPGRLRGPPELVRSEPMAPSRSAPRRVLFAAHATVGHTSALRAIGARLREAGHAVGFAMVRARLPLVRLWPASIRAAVELAGAIRGDGFEVLPLAPHPSTLWHAARIASRTGYDELEVAIDLFTAGLVDQARAVHRASRAAFTYAFPIDALIQALKYGGQLALAGWFAHELLKRLGQPSGVDLIVPLPLHPARMAERGFNQAAEIAKALARESGIAMDAHIAKRLRNTAAQTGLPWREREANMRQAFGCERELSGLSIAVIDDVMTTGATLNEFARTLKQSGAARVENWVVARTPPGV